MKCKSTQDIGQERNTRNKSFHKNKTGDTHTIYTSKITHPEDEVEREHDVSKELEAAAAVVAALHLDGAHGRVGLALSPALEGVAGLWRSDGGGCCFSTTKRDTVICKIETIIRKSLLSAVLIPCRQRSCQTYFDWIQLDLAVLTPGRSSER